MAIALCPIYVAVTQDYDLDLWRILMIGSRWGKLRYFLLRNDILWKKLSDAEKEIILVNNARHNVVRPDYANPELYAGGENFDSISDRGASTRGRLLMKYLNEQNPQTILEIGFGSGFLTRSIVEHKSVMRYIGVDINPAFIDYLGPKLEIHKASRPGFDYRLITSEINSLNKNSIKVDSIIILSAIHHIPDRHTLFELLVNMLDVDGTIFTHEPCHYFPRKLYLLDKIHNHWKSADYFLNTDNYATHHFCSREEYQNIAGALDQLSLASCHYSGINFPKAIRKVATKFLDMKKVPRNSIGEYEIDNTTTVFRFFADEITAIFRKSQ